VLPAALRFGALGLAATGCDNTDQTGVCTGYPAAFNRTSGKDGWTHAECAAWNRIGVNGVTWPFDEGQTCAGRGAPATP